MKTKYVLFGRDLLITSLDRDEAKSRLKSWNSLHAFLSRGTYDEEYLMKLVVIEKEGRGREQIISRLHSAMISLRRKEQLKELKL